MCRHILPQADGGYSWGEMDVNAKHWDPGCSFCKSAKITESQTPVSVDLSTTLAGLLSVVAQAAPVDHQLPLVKHPATKAADHWKPPRHSPLALHLLYTGPHPIGKARKGPGESPAKRGSHAQTGHASTQPCYWHAAAIDRVRPSRRWGCLDAKWRWAFHSARKKNCVPGGNLC
jgi:hypothetical protein